MSHFYRLSYVVLGLVAGNTVAQVDDPTFSGSDRLGVAAKKSVGLDTTDAAAPSWVRGSAYACHTLADGKLVVAGYEGRNLVVARYNLDGSVDASFGDQGYFRSSGFNIWYEGGMGLDVQSDGKIVVAVMNYFSGTGSITLFRLTSDGQLDSSFGGTGVLGKSVSERAFLKQLFVLPDGKLLTGGNCPAGIWAARYLPNGAADSSFGANGVSIISQPTRNSHAGQVGQLQPLSDGKMLILSVAILSSSVEAWAVDRLTASGQIDSTFRRIVLPYSGTNTWIGSMAVMNDDRIAVTIPAASPSFGSSIDVGVYSPSGDFIGYAGGTATHLISRRDGSLCGVRGKTVVELWPSKKTLETFPSLNFNCLRGYSLDDGGLGFAGAVFQTSIGIPTVYRYSDSPVTGPGRPSLELLNPSVVPNGGVLDFGALQKGQTTLSQQLTIRNSGTLALTGMTLAITGMNAADFSAEPPLPASLPVGGEFTFTLVFSPKAAGLRSAFLKIFTSSPLLDGPFSYTLQGDSTSLVDQPIHLQLVDQSGQKISLVQGRHLLTAGSNADGQTAGPQGEDQLGSVAAGRRHSLALRVDGTVIAWGSNASGQTSVPEAAQRGVVAIAAGHHHSLALSADGSVIAWGANESGQTDVPSAAQSGVVAITAGAAHTVALKQNGEVIAWGLNDAGQTLVPATARSGIIAIAAGDHHTLALRQDGSVIAWGKNTANSTVVPKAAKSGIAAVAAGAEHSLALTRDGRVIAWGSYNYGEIHVPSAARADVVAISAGYHRSAAIKRDGSAVAWGARSSDLKIPHEGGHSGAVGLALGEEHLLLLMENAGDFGSWPLGGVRNHYLSILNDGVLNLTGISARVEGPSADQFRISYVRPPDLKPNVKIALSVQFRPTRIGAHTASLKVFSNDPASPFILPLNGVGNIRLSASKVGSAGVGLVYNSLRLDRQTGLMLQKITFSNRTGTKLLGLKLILSKVALGTYVFSSNLGTEPGTLEVLYTQPIAGNETVSFDLVYSDPRRRAAASFHPIIEAEPLLDAQAESLPVGGTEIPLRSVRSTPNGPFLEWTAMKNALYVVEYSDDGGSTWFSAVHQLRAAGTRYFWLDRGQPETRTKPLGKPNQVGGRFYRVKRLP